MSRYTTITTDIWHDKEFKRLSAVGKTVYLFVLTSPYSNQCGFYRLPLDCVEFALGKRGAEELTKNATTLYKYDEDNEVVFIPNYLKYNVAKSPQQINGVARAAASLPYSYLTVDFTEKYIEYCGEEALTKLPRPLLQAVQMAALRRATRDSMALASLLESYI